MMTGGGAARGITGAPPDDDASSPSAFGGAEPRGGGADCDSRRGLGGGASLRDIESLPGRDAGGGIGDVRMSGRLGAPEGRLGVPTETTGTLGILSGGGMLSALELAPSAVTSASSTVEISGFEVMQV
jgi:hypothetical protein